MHFRYDIKPVLSDLSLNIYRGEKIALVGINGAGKTTMTRLLTGQLQPVAGTVGLGERVQVGYYAQHQIDTLNLDRTVFQEVSESADPAHRTSIRDILGMFRFTGEEVDKKIAVLSGGEKARVSLAKILLSPVNFLIMDEPTNHLDARSREALEKALNNYEGTLLVISHDRYFLDKLVSRVVELRDAGLTVYEGNYSDYLLRRKKVEPISESQASASAKNDSGASAPRSDKDRKRQEAEARQRISGQRKELAGKIEILESQIEQLESEKSELEVQMADPDFYKNEQRAADAGKRYQEVSDLIPVRMQEWESAQEELENLLESLK
jgi:ATP-binding cassette subfamily F protein 3